MPDTPKQTSSPQPAVVLVHGAFADATGWQMVIPLLQKRGYTVVAVQNPLDSFEADVANTRRVLSSQNGPIVLVGHSYGGAVITAAATGNDAVKALVYIAAFAPDIGDSMTSLSARAAPTALGTGVVPDAGNFLSIDPAKFREIFANDLPPEETKVMAATQKPIFAPIFDTTIEKAAWRKIPSWYLVSSEDRAINPDLQRMMAKSIGATTSEVKASHVSFISKPERVAEVIDEAARSAAGHAARGAA